MRVKLALILAALVLLQACETPETYPISGEECGPNDPVQELSAENCRPPV